MQNKNLVLIINVKRGGPRVGTLFALLYRKNQRFLPIQQKYILQKIAMQFSVDEQLNGACKI